MAYISIYLIALQLIIHSHICIIHFLQPYLHESRHLHALRRARGNGGRFLNTKKLEHNDSSAAIEKGNDTGATLVTNKENQGSSNALPSVQKLQGFDIGYCDGNGFAAVCHSQANGKQEGEFFGKERDSSGAIKWTSLNYTAIGRYSYYKLHTRIFLLFLP